MTYTPDFSDLETIDIPLQDLPDDMAARLMLAVHRYGRIVEYKCYNSNWMRISDAPLYEANRFYRLAPSPKTPDTVDWSHVHESIQYIARNKNGNTFGYTMLPEAKLTIWSATTNGRCINGIYSSYKEGTCDWKESLLTRPNQTKE